MTRQHANWPPRQRQHGAWQGASGQFHDTKERARLRGLSDNADRKVGINLVLVGKERRQWVKIKSTELVKFSIELKGKTLSRRPKGNSLCYPAGQTACKLRLHVTKTLPQRPVSNTSSLSPKPRRCCSQPAVFVDPFKNWNWHETVPIQPVDLSHIWIKKNQASLFNRTLRDSGFNFFNSITKL